MMADQSVPGVEVTEQGLWETFSLEEDVTETAPTVETIGLSHMKRSHLGNVAALVLLLTLFCIVVTLVAHMALTRKIKSAQEYPKMKDEETQQKLQELVDFMDSCRSPPENRPRGKTVNLLRAGVQLTVEAVEMTHEDNWPPEDVVASIRNEIEEAIEMAVIFLNRHETKGNRREAFRINARDPGGRGVLHFSIIASK